MIEFAALTYGVLASFVMSSASRNRREQRSNPPMVALVGLTLMSLSGAMAVLMLGYAVVEVLTGAASTI